MSAMRAAIRGSGEGKALMRPGSEMGMGEV
jgi:hypothetical protein